MALLGNYTVLAKNPGRAFSGSTISDNRSQWNKSGANRGRFSGWAAYSSLAATPNGYTPPGSWVIAIDGGGMSSWNQITGTGTFTSSGALGLNAEAAMTGTGSLTGTAQLVVSAVATLSGTGTLSGNLLAVLNAVAGLTGSGTVSATLLADAFAVAALTGTGSLTAPPYAEGELAAEILPYTELSPQSLAVAVWDAIAADSNLSGSMGEAVNIIAAILRNKTITDPVAGTFTVYDTDGTTVLLEGDLFQDAAGTTPYAGSGAERRERLT